MTISKRVPLQVLTSFFKQSKPDFKSSSSAFTSSTSSTSFPTPSALPKNYSSGPKKSHTGLGILGAGLGVCLYAVNQGDSKEKEAAVQTNYKNVPQLLKEVMGLYGYKKKQQLGILLLLQVYGIDVPGKFADHTEANRWLIDATQKLLRKGGERWSQENKIIEDKLQGSHEKVQSAADLLGMCDAITPSFNKQKHSDDELPRISVVIPGALDTRVKERIKAFLEYYAQHHEKDCIIERVFLSSGERQLQASECPKITEPQDRTEPNMFQLEWKEACGKDGISVEMIIGKKQPGAERATTVDAAKALIEHPKLKPGTRVVVVAEQPYIRLAATYAKELQGKNCQVEILAKAPHPTTQAFIWGDELGRGVYLKAPEVTQLLEAQKSQKAQVEVTTPHCPFT